MALRALALGSLLAMAALPLGGCLDEPSGGAQRTTTVDERRQAVDQARVTLGGICKPASAHARVPATSGRLPPDRRTKASGAVDRLIQHAEDSSDADYETAAAARELLTNAASDMERLRCLVDLVPRIDRALRLMALPDPETYYDDGYDYEPTPDEYLRGR